MADAQDTRWNEFEGLGEEQVHKRLAAHIWGEEKEALARQWLEFRETNKSSTDTREGLALAKEANDLARLANDTARSGNVIATVALFFAVWGSEFDDAGVYVIPRPSEVEVRS